MSAVTAILAQDKYKTRLLSATNEIIADEPVDLGGTDLGFSPGELLSASLASCTAITLRMYANRNNWTLTQIKVDVQHERDNANNITRINRRISFEGELDEKQTNKLLAIANACPMHKLLKGTIEIDTSLK